MKRRTLTFLAMSRSLQASWAFLSVSAMRCVNSSLRDCTLELSSFRLIISLQNIFTHLTLSPSVDQSNSHYCSFPNDTGDNTRYGWIPSPAFNSIDLKWGFFFFKKTQILEPTTCKYSALKTHTQAMISFKTKKFKEVLTDGSQHHTFLQSWPIGAFL